MKNIRNIVLFGLLFNLMLSYGNNIQYQQKFYKLQTIIQNENSTKSEVFQFTKSLPINLLYKIGELSSEDIRSNELGIVNLEVRNRIKKNIDRSYLINQISTNEFQPDYAFFLFSNLYNNQKYYSSKELIGTIGILRNSIVDYKNKKYKHRIYSIKNL